MTQTKTATTSGLQTFFQQDSFLGIPMNATTALILSSIWSLKTSVMLYLKAIRVQKGFFGTKASCCVALWGLVGSLRRVSSLVCFFAPSLGLFSILNHWQAELYPYSIRKQLNLIHKTDQVHLFNLTENIRWSELDRWNYYEDPNEPTPPSYTLYTGFTLKWTFVSFLVITTIHAFSMLVVKVLTSEEFKQDDKNTYNKLLHIVDNINCSLPYKDWDEYDEENTTKEQFQQRFQSTENEMLASQLLNIGVSIIMLLPIWFTGKELIYSYLI